MPGRSYPDINTRRAFFPWSPGEWIKRNKTGCFLHSATRSSRRAPVAPFATVAASAALLTAVPLVGTVHSPPSSKPRRFPDKSMHARSVLRVPCASLRLSFISVRCCFTNERKRTGGGFKRGGRKGKVLVMLGSCTRRVGVSSTRGLFWSV